MFTQNTSKPSKTTIKVIEIVIIIVV